MNRETHVERQRSFYESGEHTHLRPGANDHYAVKIVSRLADAVGLRPHHRVLEVGAGFGRFTFPLLERCESVVALDVSERVLADLDRTREERSIPRSRCRTVCGDAIDVSPDSLGGPVDAIVGFFLLHHLPDLASTLRALLPVLVPGGTAAFVDPNRRNPAFLAQVLLAPDMTWAQEKGMFRLSWKRVQAALQDAGFSDPRCIRFGFFPPQLINRFAAARRLEAAVESLGLLGPVLPFLLMSARRADGGG